MSKTIYTLKLHLLSTVFKMSPSEENSIKELAVFISVVYVKAWFMAPLAKSAARSDLTHMMNMMKYRLHRPRMAWTVLETCHRHLWYVCPQLITLALADDGLDGSQRENIAKALHAQERTHIKPGKPTFPNIDWSGDKLTLPDMGSLVTSESWLIFDILNLQGSQVINTIIYLV